MATMVGTRTVVRGNVFEAYCRFCDDAVEASGEWPGKCTDCGRRIEPHPVPDVAGPNLRLLFVGINPSVETARQRAHFGNPHNPFWRLLHESSLTPILLEPKEQRRLLDFGLGVTNAVTRATRGSAGITADDRRHGRARLEDVIDRNRPARVAFVGKQAFAFGTGREGAPWGPQEQAWRNVPAFVLPSTSPANAAVHPRDKLEWFRRLRQWVDEA